MIKYPFEVHRADLGNAIQMAYCDEGAGPYTLLFIHGLANYLPVFRHNINELKLHYRCIAIDLPGNGLSSKGDYPYSMFFYAETVARFIQKQQLQNVVLVGHSMGGQISLILSLRHPQLVHKLVLLAPSGLEPFSEMESGIIKTMLNFGNMLYGDAMSLEAAIQNSYYHEAKKDAKHIIRDLLQLMQGEEGRYWRQMVKCNIEAMLDEQVFPFLPQLQQETLILLGKNDSFIPNTLIHLTESAETIGQRAVATIPRAHYEVLKHCGHFVQIEAAATVNDRICQFLPGDS